MVILATRRRITDMRERVLVAIRRITATSRLDQDIDTNSMGILKLRSAVGRCHLRRAQITIKVIQSRRNNITITIRLRCRTPRIACKGRALHLSLILRAQDTSRPQLTLLLPHRALQARLPRTLANVPEFTAMARSRPTDPLEDMHPRVVSSLLFSRRPLLVLAPKNPRAPAK